MRPLICTLPLVGAVIRERILSSVLLPAPLRPMMPRISPCSTSNETSLSAQIVSPERLPIALADPEQWVGFAARLGPPELEVVG